MVRDWVSALGLREQGVLLVALRGCDSAPKFPLDSPERRMTAALRYAICNPFDPREVDAARGCFMLSAVPTDVRLGHLEHYPLHWVLHVIHACQVLGVYEPNEDKRQQWWTLYREFCRSMHVEPETRDAMQARLQEDRIANDSVVKL
jgi:hypothetical protein